ncbi:H-type small acid-soluble spore protein [Biomaibacter acetigenes]|uniref:H-type small acid-soluble spore protein n=1 Tax=Biomaibacter acetigenes TaxID=2316383 RepID=A0A3G2R8B4_9FIRM|nr:H-type small acid-soluble spore protein [Biomaibacter acetigenes]AYO31639.1 H-type small acid-soluble spore protein [Biomaibacter acetigenes]
MEFERAQEIVNSPDTYEVFYKNKLVWINGLDPKSKTVHIKILSEDFTEDVPVNELKEGKNLH